MRAIGSLETSIYATVNTSTLVFAQTASAGQTHFTGGRLDGELHIECQKVQVRHFPIELFREKKTQVTTGELPQNTTNTACS